MYRLSLSGLLFVVGLVLWFRPVLGLIALHRYWGPPDNATTRRYRERGVLAVSVVCIVVGTAAAVIVILAP